jgi:hypothetical protein
VALKKQSPGRWREKEKIKIDITKNGIPANKECGQLTK